MDKVKIFVCTHKPVDNIRNNDVYTPIHLGRSYSSFKNEMMDYIGDDSGDNISDKSEHYSEASAIYWIWKNVHNCEYVGLTQYRRTFDIEFTSENIDSLFSDGTDVILSQKYFRPSTRWHAVLTYMQMEDFLIMKGCIEKCCPEYLKTLNRFLRDYEDYPFNMVVCKKQLYDQYAKWMFEICFEMEKYVKYSGYSNSARLFGYITELLTPIYFLHNKYKIKEVPVLLEGVKIKMSLKGKMMMKFLHNTLWKIRKDIPVNIDSSFYRGLKRDNIIIK